MTSRYDALLLVSFGGPEGPDDVLPFLRNVVRGRNVPEARLQQVARQYDRVNGVSPINQQNRTLLRALEVELSSHGHSIPLYWGNRNWNPMLADTVARMVNDGVRRALAFVTSAYSSYSSCRQYLEDIAGACEPLGTAAPTIEKIRPFFNHPGFIETNRARLKETFDHLPQPEPDRTKIYFTAHSLPVSMADGCDYENQLRETSRLVARDYPDHPWQLVFQSRSGPPTQPWLEPDVLDAFEADAEIKNKIVSPIGFVSDHMEIVFDLDTQARSLAEEQGARYLRAQTAGTHPRFVQMVRELMEERLFDGEDRPAAEGLLPPRPFECPHDCCPAPTRPNTAR